MMIKGSTNNVQKFVWGGALKISCYSPCSIYPNFLIDFFFYILFPINLYFKGSWFWSIIPDI